MELSAKSSPGHQPWDGFLTSSENALAHAAVIALGKGEGISPLVIHGMSGVGKTRLLTGLVTERSARRPGSAVAFLAGEAFAAQCAQAGAKPGGWSEFRARFRSVDLFVLDNLHDLERVPMALAELAHTLDALDELGAAVAVSARTAPGQWSHLPKRLVSRLIGGLAVRVEPPALEARRRYLLDRLQSRHWTLSAPVIELLAQTGDSYRALDGLLARLILEKKVAPSSLSLNSLESLAREPGTVSVLSVSDVARDVACAFGLSVRDLRSASRRAGLVVPRHLAIYLAREVTGLSFAKLGAFFGHRDAATIRHACEACMNRLAADPSLAALAFALRGQWSHKEPGAIRGEPSS